MGHDASQFRAAFMKNEPHFGQEFSAGFDAGAVTVGVDFDQNRNGVLSRSAGGGHGFGLLTAIEDDGNVDALAAQLHHARKFRGRDANGIENVAHARRRELFSLFERRNGRWTFRSLHE